MQNVNRFWLMAMSCLLGGIPACTRLAPEKSAQAPLQPAGISFTSTAEVSNTNGENDRSAERIDETVASWVSVPELPRELALLPSVFWEPEDTTSLRKRIRETDLVKGRRVLEIGTGSGLIALCCLQAGAVSVVATDLNPAAIRNALQNADRLGFRDQLDCRLVPRRSPGAWTVLRDHERFDLIISNPPWEDQKPTSVTEFALYDPGFELLMSLVTGARQRLNPGGRMLLAYGCVAAIRKIQEIGASRQLDVRILDDRPLDSLPEVFLPGMLIEIKVP